MSSEDNEYKGGTVAFCGGTDWQMIGRSAGGKKSDKDKQADEERAAKFPNLTSPHTLKALQTIRIRFVAAGSAACHCVIGDLEGKCYTWGRNEKGQLGQRDMQTRGTPTLVKDLAGIDVISGAGGRHHTAIVTACGESWTWGSNLQGQCGTGSLKSQPKSEELLLEPKKTKEVADCTDVACGAEFTMWLCDGRVFSAGLPQYGQLGHGTDHEYNAKDSSVKIMYQPQPTPEVIQGLTHTTIRKIACGHNHTLALDDKGAAFTWGNGGYGRLGHQVQQDEHKPRQISVFDRAPVDKNSTAACGSTSSFCSGIGGALYGWGKLKASGDNTMYPKPAPGIEGWTILSMACGSQTFATASQYQKETSIITWGQASNGELGYGDKGKKSSANPDKCPVLDNVPTRQVACGVGFSMFLVDPEHEAVKKLPDFEAPEDAPDESSNGAAEPAAKGKGKGRGGGATKKAAEGPASKKRKTEEKPASRGRGRPKK
ncbi:hypothetical protein WJX84_004668 [Apatococcus fuscideae]|uniref:RCC1-like domain-containing protein n=1 Tax=Apatococcus fuscideae TaxID=2026836 RepID=A0AAW1T5U1_9CHLO